MGAQVKTISLYRDDFIDKGKKKHLHGQQTILKGCYGGAECFISCKNEMNRALGHLCVHTG